MSEGPGVDTDVVLKSAALRVGTALLRVLSLHGEPGALGLTHLIAERQLRKLRGLRDGLGAQLELRRILDGLAKLEPNEGEVLLAAEFAARAQEQGLPLDSGEAQLFAMLLSGRLPLVVTGDKRAIAALSKLLNAGDERDRLAGRIACFEQVIEAIFAIEGEHEVRARVCAEPDVDGALRLACSCDQEGWHPEQLREACASFVGSLKGKAGDLLIERLLLA